MVQNFHIVVQRRYEAVTCNLEDMLSFGGRRECGRWLGRYLYIVCCISAAGLEEIWFSSFSCLDFEDPILNILKFLGVERLL